MRKIFKPFIRPLSFLFPRLLVESDPFELSILKRSLWGVIFFLFLTSILSFLPALLAKGTALTYYQPYVIKAYCLAILFNGLALIYLTWGRPSGKIIKWLPNFLVPMNFLISFSEQFLAEGNLFITQGSLMLLSFVYLGLWSLLIKRITDTIIFGIGLFLFFVVVFGFLPIETYLTRLMTFEELKTSTYILLLFSIPTTVLLTILGQYTNEKILTHNKQITQKLEAVAYKDTSTNLPNALQLEVDLKLLKTEFSQGPTQPLVLFGFRLDGLKPLNEAQGFEIVSQIVQDLTIHFQNQLTAFTTKHPEWAPPSHIKSLYRVDANIYFFLFRWLPQLQVEKKVSLDLSLKEILLETFRLKENYANIGFHGGFILFPEDTSTFTQLSRNLLNILYSDRKAAFNQFLPFNPSRYDEFLKNEKIRLSILPGLEHREFSLAFQPKIDIASSRLIGFEALARWTHPELGWISPTVFIPLAEQYDTIRPLTDYLFKELVTFLRQLAQTTYTPCRISFNLTPVLLDSQWLDHFTALIKQHDCGRYLELEITESTLMQLYPSVLTKFKILKELGVCFSIDDFGVGYSNLGYLQKFEADFLKIDKSFVDDIHVNEKSAHLMKAILQMAKSLGMRTIAEGVELEAQKDLLKEYHCDTIQGYFYSKPLSPDLALEYFIKMNRDLLV